MKKILTNKKQIIDGPNQRVAQACDRCRAKKTKCDGKNPCTPCVLVGLECIVSDKLLRRAFPKGYTETLEERIRQLEAENKKLLMMLDVRDEQLEMASEVNSEVNPLTLTNLHIHDDSECPCGCDNPLAHQRPVLLAGLVYEPAPSITGSIAGLLRDFHVSDDADDFDIAPQAFAAATAIAKIMKHENKEQQRTLQLTQLVAILSPRLTEETLFIPQLLARICQLYGYSLKQAVLTANCLSLLKNSKQTPLLGTPAPLIMNRECIKLDDVELVNFIYGLKLPNKMDLDRLLTIYFQEWNLPIVDQARFFKNYSILTSILETGRYPQGVSPGQLFDSLEKFGAILVIIVALALMLSRSNTENSTHYDQLIREFIKPNCIVTAHCTMLLLTVLALALQYCLVIGDIASCYELRARAITMAQQLRLHRCPAAVLGMTGDAGDDMQAERRILFWCLYCLDVYASLDLGVPRLLKDFEIECAMPFTNNDESNVNILVINNTRLPIVGRVTKFAHAFMLYCKVLGAVLDLIFSRYDQMETQSQALERDKMLESWRRDLPSDLRFDVDINGFSVKELGSAPMGETIWRQYLKQQLILIFVYFHAKILIYLPILSRYGNHHNVGLSEKEKLSRGDNNLSSVLLLGLMVQQSLIQILEVLQSILKNTTLTTLPLPLNVAQEQARFALMVAKGSLEYTKGGPLQLNAKRILLETLALLSDENRGDLPGTLTPEALKLLELLVHSIIGVPFQKKKSRPVPTTTPLPALAARGVAAPSMDYTVPTSEFDDIEAILNFDPYKLPAAPLRSHAFTNNEFAADGSFGLVPLLDNWHNFDTSNGML